MIRRAAAAAAAIAAIAVASCSRTAAAGGLEIPDNGAEGLGRGGAFTAKADDPTAIHYNVAGLAGQRGTRLFVGSNVARSSLAFQPRGTYADDPARPGAPYAGKPYPEVTNQGGLFVEPFAALTSDLGTERLGFALGVFAPPTVGGRQYPATVGGAPSPARYDVGGGDSLILFYTAGAAMQLTDAIAVGLEAHVVEARFSSVSTSYAELSPGSCAGAETRCDAMARGEGSGWSASASAGVLAHPADGWWIGVHARAPVDVQAVGRAQILPPGGTTPLPSTEAAIHTALPWIFRVGIRRAVGEGADVEVDATYERWSDAQSPGPEIRLASLAGAKDARSIVLHRYADTISARLGAAVAVTPSVTLRAGGFYDAPATTGAYTRLDEDTLAKLAATVGAGARAGAFTFSLAYASVFDVSRDVESGALRPSSPLGGAAKAPVNEGRYHGHTHIASFGVTVRFDALFGAASAPGGLPPGTRTGSR